MDVPQIFEQALQQLRFHRDREVGPSDYDAVNAWVILIQKLLDAAKLSGD